MIRWLLTLLAILTGLSSLSAPAYARYCAQDNAPVAAAGPAQEQANPSDAAQQAVFLTLPASREPGEDARPVAFAGILAPTVRILVDRALQ